MDQGFLSRWSRLKQAARIPATEAPPTEAAHAAEPPATEKDLVGLVASSDYTRFLDPRVAPGVRVAALRTLWRSNPGLSACDGLIDYAGDYTKPY